MCTNELEHSRLPKLYTNIRTTLRKLDGSNPESPLKDLRLYREINQTKPAPSHKVIKRILGRGLEMLQTDEPEYAKILEMLFWQKMTRKEVAHALNCSIQAIDRSSRLAVKKLEKYIHNEEELARLRFQATIDERLEFPSTMQVFGIDKPHKMLSDLLASEEDPWLISIEGIGGIGKTTLANTLIRCAINRNLFDDFGWISARPDRFYLHGKIEAVGMPALTPEQLIEGLARQLLGDSLMPSPFSFDNALHKLRERLKQLRHIIVIDNLETLADIEMLLPTLQKLVNPTKFILTSRKSLYPNQSIYQFKVPPLSETDALGLLRYEARQRASQELITAGDGQLQQIFSATGGNPLALRLIVGQTCLFDLDIVLNNLKEAQGETVENLYEFIYRRFWDTLDDNVRRVFIAMPLVEQGGSFAEIVRISGMNDAVVTDALAQLVMLNLVNRSRLGDESLYSIHSLTRTFLLKHVTKWQQP